MKISYYVICAFTQRWNDSGTNDWSHITTWLSKSNKSAQTYCWTCCKTNGHTKPRGKHRPIVRTWWSWTLVVLRLFNWSTDAEQLQQWNLPVVCVSNFITNYGLDWLQKFFSSLLYSVVKVSKFHLPSKKLHQRCSQSGSLYNTQHIWVFVLCFVG